MKKIAISFICASLLVLVQYGCGSKKDNPKPSTQSKPFDLSLLLKGSGSNWIFKTATMNNAAGDSVYAVAAGAPNVSGLPIMFTDVDFASLPTAGNSGQLFSYSEGPDNVIPWTSISGTNKIVITLDSQDVFPATILKLDAHNLVLKFTSPWSFLNATNYPTHTQTYVR